MMVSQDAVEVTLVGKKLIGSVSPIKSSDYLEAMVGQAHFENVEHLHVIIDVKHATVTKGLFVHSEPAVGGTSPFPVAPHR